MLLEFAQKHYFAEFDRRSALNSTIPILVSLSTIFVAGFAYALQFSGFTLRIETYVTQILLVSAISFGGFSFSFFQFFGFDYNYIASIDKYVAFHDELATKDRGIGPTCDSVFSAELAANYAKAATGNSEINDRKATLLLRSNQFIMVALGLVAFAGFVSKVFF